MRVEVMHLGVRAAHVQRGVPARGAALVVVVVHGHHGHDSVAALDQGLGLISQEGGREGGARASAKNIKRLFLTSQPNRGVFSDNSAKA